MVYLKFAKPQSLFVKTECNGSHWEVINRPAYVKIGQSGNNRDGEVPDMSVLLPLASFYFLIIILDLFDSALLMIFSLPVYSLDIPCFLSFRK